MTRVPAHVDYDERLEQALDYYLNTKPPLSMRPIEHLVPIADLFEVSHADLRERLMRELRSDE